MGCYPQASYLLKYLFLCSVVLFVVWPLRVVGSILWGRVCVIEAFVVCLAERILSMPWVRWGRVNPGFVTDGNSEYFDSVSPYVGFLMS